MSAVEFNNQQIKFCDFPKIQLDDIDERCGEVYITLSGVLVFHCSLCASNYGSIDNFLDHLTTEHYKYAQEKKYGIDNDVETGPSSSETLVEDYSNGKLCHEQSSDNDIYKYDDDVEDDGNKNGINKYVDDVAGNVGDDDDIDGDYDDNIDDDVNDDDIDEYEEMLQGSDAAILDTANSERIVVKLEASNAVKFKDEIEIEDTSETWNRREKNSRTKPRRQYRKKATTPFICKECGKEFGRKVLLKRHYLIHSDERKYKCKYCNFAFKDRSNLDSHVRRHLGTNKIECGYCPKTFFTQTEVTSHRRIHTGERPYACSICDKAYTTPNRLKMHSKRHTSEPTFRCSYCEKGFYERFRYQDHILVHTKEKHFVCEICAATFPRHKSWLRHSKIHEKPAK